MKEFLLSAQKQLSESGSSEHLHCLVEALTLVEEKKAKTVDMLKDLQGDVKCKFLYTIDTPTEQFENYMSFLLNSLVQVGRGEKVIIANAKVSFEIICLIL